MPRLPLLIVLSILAVSCTDRGGIAAKKSDKILGDGDDVGGAEEGSSIQESRDFEPGLEARLVVVIKDAKFKKFDGKDLRYSLSFAGKKITKKRLRFKDDIAKITVSDLETGDKGNLTIRFYVEDEPQPKLKALQPKYTVKKERTELKLRDCRITSAVWDGTEDEGTCTWEIK